MNDDLIKSFDDHKDDMKLKMEFYNSLIFIEDSDGSPYFSKEWIIKNILGYDDKK